MPKLATLVATTFANFFSLAMAIKTVVASLEPWKA